MSSLHFFLTRAACSVVEGNDTPALGTSIFFFLLFHETLQAMRLNKTAICCKARLIPLVIAFFKAFHQTAWIFEAFKAVGKGFFSDTVFYFAFAAMLRLSFIAVQAPGTWLFMIAVPIAYLAIHSAGGKHIRINFFSWHFHRHLLLGKRDFYRRCFLNKKMTADKTMSAAWTPRRRSFFAFAYCPVRK